VRRRIATIAAVAVIASIASAAWITGGVFDVYQAIFPGLSTEPSRSMEPYDLIFRFDTSTPDTKRSDGPKASIAEWHLRLPRAYILSQINSNEAVGGGIEHKHHVASIYAILDPQRERFSPGVLGGRTTEVAQGFVIKPNNGASPKISRQCLRDHDWHRVYGGELQPSRQCGEGKIRCTVHSSYLGWRFRILMPKAYYFGDYQKSCDAVMRFFEEHTIEIDDRSHTSGENG
jgi:hypothetical protein